MTDRVLAAVIEAIQDRGPITFAEYMEIALYGPGGYYEEPPVGSEGDFVTSPHVHPVFGAFVAEAVRATWSALGRPDPFNLIEAGAGDGTLLRQMLGELDDLPLRAIAVERSAGARRALASIDGVEILEHLPGDGGGVVVAHELLDNLAFRRIRGTEDGPREVRIAVSDGSLSEVLTPVSDTAGGGTEPGGEVVIPVGAIDLALGALAVSEPRALLAIDYGAEDGSGGGVHGYRDHRVVDDVLGDPGGTDITAGVDFGALRAAVTSAGSHAFASVTQRHALTALGFEPWLLTQLELQTDLLRTGRGGDAVRAWGGRSRATMLVDPAGLGRFRWFLAANVAMSEPRWLTDARLDEDA